MAFDIKAALAKIAANPQDSGDPRGAGGYWTGGGGDGGMGEYTPYIPFSKTGSYFNEGMALTPLGNGTYAVYKPAEPGKASRLNGQTYQIVDAGGNVVGQNVWRGIEDQNAEQQFAIAASMMALPMALTAAGVAGAAGGAAGGAGAGAAGGAGFAGDMTAAGYAGLDAASASTLGGGASGAWGGGLGAAGAGAGAGFVGDATAAGYGGLDAASTTSMGGGASGAWGGGAAAGGGGLGAGAGGGSAPPANPFLNGGGSSMLDSAGGFDWKSLIGPALSAAGGVAGANAASDAADAQLQATREAAALQEPFRQGGMAAMNRLLELNGIGGNPASEGYGSAQKDFTAADFAAGMDPGYAWRLEQGQLGLERAASAKGGLGSGGYLKDAMAYNSGLASQEYGQAYNRYQTNRAAKLNPLQSLMGSGQTAANTIGGYTIDGGNATAAGKVGQANALTSAIGQGYSMYQNGQQQTANNALMERFLTYRGA